MNQAAEKGQTKFDYSHPDGARHTHVPGDLGGLFRVPQLAFKDQEQGAHDRQRDADRRRHVEPNGHRGDVLITGFPGDPSGHSHIQKNPDDDADQSARDDAILNNIEREAKNRQKGAQYEQIDHAIK